MDTSDIIAIAALVLSGIIGGVSIAIGVIGTVTGIFGITQGNKAIKLAGDSNTLSAQANAQASEANTKAESSNQIAMKSLVESSIAIDEPLRTKAGETLDTLIENLARCNEDATTAGRGGDSFPARTREASRLLKGIAQQLRNPDERAPLIDCADTAKQAATNFAEYSTLLDRADAQYIKEGGPQHTRLMDQAERALEAAHRLEEAAVESSTKARRALARGRGGTIAAQSRSDTRADQLSPGLASDSPDRGVTQREYIPHSTHRGPTAKIQDGSGHTTGPIRR